MQHPNPVLAYGACASDNSFQQLTISKGGGGRFRLKLTYGTYPFQQNGLKVKYKFQRSKSKID